jgi:hypothetical protein
MREEIRGVRVGFLVYAAFVNGLEKDHIHLIAGLLCAMAAGAMIYQGIKR